jgi:hypothetical protein
MTKIHFPKVDDFAGFAMENAPKGATSVSVLQAAALTSDEPAFHLFIDNITGMFLSRKEAPILANSVSQFLVIIHADLSADLYVNDFSVVAEIMAKRSIQMGEIVSQEDIADIRRMKFANIPLVTSDKVIYCFKTGWRFGLIFNVGRPAPLDIDAFELACGSLHRYLAFRHIYQTLETTPQYEHMLADGWFPFVEMLGRDFKLLRRAYEPGALKADLTNQVTDSFTPDRVRRIGAKWWSNLVFQDKRSILEAGINAFIANTADGFIQCIKTLYPEVEGITRAVYLADKGTGSGAKTKDLLAHVVAKGRAKSGSESSLFLPLEFLSYLNNVIFASFDVDAGKVEISRHSASHGVARPAGGLALRTRSALQRFDGCLQTPSAV